MENLIFSSLKKKTSQEIPLLWYAMSAPYGRERKAEKKLEDQKVECFIPKRRVEEINAQCQRVVTYVPVIRNLIFVHATEKRMRELKGELNKLIQFMMCPKATGRKQPVIVPDKQMSDFIRLYQSIPDQLIYLSPDEISNLRENARVVIGDGLFKGVEGYYQKVKGKKNKHFIVKIENFLACATLLVDCTFIKMTK